jgi:hypothetical protein
VTPDDLAARHPRLHHVTLPPALDTIAARGLLTTSQLLDLFEVQGGARAEIEARRRGAAVPIEHPRHGTAIIDDQLAMTEAALAAASTRARWPMSTRLASSAVRSTPAPR